MTRKLLPTAGILTLLLTAACVERQQEPGAEPETRATRFDPETVGNVTGTVKWVGELPNVPPLVAWKLLGRKDQGRFLYDNPNTPAVETKDRGVAGAVVGRSSAEGKEPVKKVIDTVRARLGRSKTAVRRLTASNKAPSEKPAKKAATKKAAAKPKSEAVSKARAPVASAAKTSAAKPTAPKTPAKKSAGKARG